MLIEDIEPKIFHFEDKYQRADVIRASISGTSFALLKYSFESIISFPSLSKLNIINATICEHETET